MRLRLDLQGFANAPLKMTHGLYFSTVGDPHAPQVAIIDCSPKFLKIVHRTIFYGAMHRRVALRMTAEKRVLHDII